MTGAWTLEQAHGGLIFPNDPISNNTAVGPTGPGGASPISGWTNTCNPLSVAAGGGYTITLTGAEFVRDGGEEDDDGGPCAGGDDDGDDD
jgi:hypothetical protein